MLLTNEQFIEKALKIYQNNEFDYSVTNYSGAYNEIIVICNKCKQHITQKAVYHLKGSGCINCNKFTTEKFIEKAKAIHSNNEYDYSLVNYINSFTKVKIKCNTCNIIFEQKPNNHLNKNGCLVCAKNSKKKTTEDFIKDALNIYKNNEYDYSKVKYIDNMSKVEIICNTCHNSFFQSRNQHIIQKHGCANCNGGLISSTEEFIKKANIVHSNNEYDYSLVNYTNNYTKVKIICNICNNIFNQTPSDHLCGYGCKKCSIKNRTDKSTSTTDEFINKAKILYPNNEYDYSLVNYVNSKIKVEIICNDCNKVFKQTPNDHLRNHGCSYCINFISKNEVKWLDEIGIKQEYNQNDINKRNHKTFGELYDRTIEKENNLKLAGYKVISIWESEYKINEIKEI